MTSFVVDASVAAKWFFNEQYTQDAIKLLNNEYELVAPDLIYAEVGNVVWKKQRINDVDTDTARIITNTLGQIIIEKINHLDIIESAVDLAISYERTVYDSLYLAAAIFTDSMLVTADKKFYNAMEKTDYSKHILWVEDLN